LQLALFLNLLMENPGLELDTALGSSDNVNRFNRSTSTLDSQGNDDFRRRSRADNRSYIPSSWRTSDVDDAGQEANDDEPMDDEVALERRLGLFSGISIIAGTMIGSGIFVSPTGVISKVGSVGVSLLVWMGCGILALLGSLCYAELGCVIPESGGEYAYFIRIYKVAHQHVGNIVAFLFAWVNITLLKPSSIAIISLVFAEYVSVPMFDACGPPDVVKKLLAIILLIVLTILNCISVKAATRAQNVFTIAKIVALIMIIIGGFIKLSEGRTNFLSTTTSFTSTTATPTSIALAFYSGLWAYDGWNQLNLVVEEIKQPRRNLPLAIFLGIPLVMILYILVNISYFTVLSPAELKASSAAAVSFGDRALGPLRRTIPFFVAASCIGAVNGSLFTAGRSVFVAAREGHVPRLLSMIHSSYKTPFPALLIQSLIAVVMALMGNIGALIDFFSFAIWLFYSLAFLANIVMSIIFQVPSSISKRFPLLKPSSQTSHYNSRFTALFSVCPFQTSAKHPG